MCKDVGCNGTFNELLNADTFRDKYFVAVKSRGLEDTSVRKYLSTLLLFSAFIVCVDVKIRSEKEITAIMRSRLNMNNISFNHGISKVCKMCRDEKESLEHLTGCKNIRTVLNDIVNIDMLNSKDTSEQFRVEIYIQKYIEMTV
jgi:hypothetical protein